MWPNKLAEFGVINFSLNALKKLNKARMRRLNVESWSGVSRKTLRNAGK